MPASDRHRATRRILIVDDIEDNCLLIEDHLQRQLKCEFRKASSGNEALQILKKLESGLHFDGYYDARDGWN